MPLVIANQTMDLDQTLPKRTLEAIDNPPHNSLDTIDRDYRRTLWHEREERHWENMDTDDDPGFGLMLVSGDKGAGKTTLISLLAGDLYDRGFSVVSNISRLFVPRQPYLPVGVNQFCRFTSSAWTRCWLRCWAAPVR